MGIWVYGLTRHYRALEGNLERLGRIEPLPTLPESPPERPLAGLRILTAITQDHPHAPFVKLLSELLLAEDVIAVSTDPGEEYDVIIEGRVTGNGYAEVYYNAEISCRTHGEPICVVIERPPHGDRPSNLALEVVTRLKTETAKRVERGERRQALRELN